MVTNLHEHPAGLSGGGGTTEGKGGVTRTGSVLNGADEAINGLPGTKNVLATRKDQEREESTNFESSSGIVIRTMSLIEQ